MRWRHTALWSPMSERRKRLPVNDLLELRLSGIQIEEVLATYEATFGRISVRELMPSHLIFSAELGPNPSRVFWQSIYSFAIALAATILTLPVVLLVIIAMKLTSPGPILYRQTRVGQDSVPFTSTDSAREALCAHCE
jgi:hypothetical protein